MEECRRYRQKNGPGVHSFWALLRRCGQKNKRILVDVLVHPANKRTHFLPFLPSLINPTTSIAFKMKEEVVVVVREAQQQPCRGKEVKDRFPQFVEDATSSYGDSNLRSLSTCYRLRSELPNSKFQTFLREYLQHETDHSLLHLLDLLIICQSYFAVNDATNKSQLFLQFKQGLNDYMLEQGFLFHACEAREEKAPTENLVAEFYLSGIAKLSGLDFIRLLVDEFQNSQ